MSVASEAGFDRHLRILAIATGMGTTIFTLLALPAILEQQAHLVPWFSLPLTALFCGLPILLIPLGRWGTTRSIVWVARLQTIAAAVLVAFWVPAMTDAGLPGDRAPWVLNTMAVAAATAVIGWKPRAAWAYLIAITCGGAVLRFVVLGCREWVVPFLDGVSMLTFCAIIATLLMVTLRAGETQDVALSRALRDATSAAEAQSRARQRVRFGSLVHDEVITTLLAATADTGSSEAVRQSARDALNRLDEFVNPPSEPAPLVSLALEVELRSAARDIVEGVTVAGSLGQFDGVVPGSVAAAMVGALAEGVRNSVAHAPVGRSVSRDLRLLSTHNSITVELVDDGDGFDITAVPQARLGIRSSIIERMASVDGGTARVISAPGSGTTVLISWMPGGAP